MASRSFQGPVAVVDDHGISRQDSPLTAVQPRGVTVHNRYQGGLVTSTVFFEDDQLDAVLAAAAAAGMTEVQG